MKTKTVYRVHYYASGATRYFFKKRDVDNFLKDIFIIDYDPPEKRNPFSGSLWNCFLKDIVITKFKKKVK